MSTTLEPRQKRRRSSKKKRNYAEFGEYIDHQLQRTRNNIRWNDIFTALCGTAVLVIGYLLAFVVFDHWIIAGGFGPVARVSLLAGLLVLTAGWLGWKVALPWLRRINRLYAARAIENVSPEFRSNLLNYVDLKEAGREVSTPVLSTIQKRAAVSLSHSEVDDAIDRRVLLRLCYVLFAIVTIFCSYAVFSPKKVGPSIWRAFAPASTVDVATETEIVEVKYEESILSREHLEVIVNLKGKEPDGVTLLYTTSDRSSVDEEFEMRPSSEGVKQFRTRLVGEDGEGLLQDFEFRILAGDDRAGPFAVKVTQPPSATVNSVRYEFPEYTQLASQSEDGGHIEAIEGTRITIAATTNMPVKRATIQWSETEVFPSRPEEDALSIDGMQLSYVWQPRLRRDGTDPKFYRIACRTADGIEDPSPAVHPIVITPDLPPEVALVHPTGDLKAAANAIIPLLVRARDPDFRLNQIRLHIKRETETLPHVDLYEGGDAEKEILFDLKLSEYRLHADDVLTCWIEVRDNRLVDGRDSRGEWQLPNNRTNSPRFEIIIEEEIPEEEAAEQHKQEREQVEQKLEESPVEPGDAGAGQEDPELKNQEGGSDPDQRDPDVKPDGDDQNQKRKDGDADKGDEPKDGQTGNESGDSKQKNSGQGDSQSGKPEDGGESGSNEEGSEGGEKKETGEPSEDGTGSQKTGEGKPDETGTGRESLRKDGGDDAEALREILKRARERQREQQSQDANSPDAQNDPQQPTERGTGQKNQNSDTESSDPKKPGQQSTAPDQNNTNDTSENREANPEGNDPGQTPPDSETSPNETTEKGNETQQSDQPKGSSTEQKNQTGEGTKPAENPDGSGSDPEATPPSDQKNNDSKGADSKPEGQPGTEGTNQSNSGSKPDEGKNGSNTDQASGNEKPSQDGKDGDTGKPNQSGMPNDGNSPDEGSNPQTGKPIQPNSPDGNSGDNSGMPKDGQSNSESKSNTGDPKDGDSKGGDSKGGGGDSGNKPSDSKDSKGKSGGDSKTPGDNPSGDGSPKDGSPTKANDTRPATNDKKNSAGSGDSPDKGETEQGTGSADSKNATTKKTDGNSQKSQNDSRTDSEQQPPKDQEASDKPSGDESKGGGKSGKSGDSKGGSGKGKDGDAKGRGKQQGGAAKGGEKGGTGSPSKGKTQPHDGPGQIGQRRVNENGEQVFDPGDVQQGDLSGGHGVGEGKSTAEAANLEDQKKATDLVLRQLKDELERGEVDQEMLDRLGWSDNDLRNFLDRMEKNLDAAESDAATDRVRRRQFEEMLKSLDVKQDGGRRLDPVGKKRETNSFEENRLAVPPEYRKAFEDYTRKLSKQQRTRGRKPASNR